MQKVVEEEDKVSIGVPKSSVEHNNININQVTADESDRMLGQNGNRNNKKKKKNKFKKNDGGTKNGNDVLPWEKDAISGQPSSMPSENAVATTTTTTVSVTDLCI